MKGEKKYSIIADHIGVPIQGYNESGEKIWERELDSYGKARVEKGDEGFCSITYQGQTYDKDIDLTYNRFRWYNQEEGVYLSQDPIGLEGGMRLYNYVHDTNSWIDPFGLSCAKVTKKGVLEIKDKFASGSIHSLQLKHFADLWNKQIAKNGGSMTRRSISKMERRAASKAAKEFRAANPHLFKNGEVAGHISDAGWGGNASGPFTPLHTDVNSYIGGATQAVPVGTTYTSVLIVP